jgi:hypothetical protein
LRRKRSPRVSTEVAESAGTFLGTPSLDLADMSPSIQSGKRPGMQSRDSQGHLQTIREQTARGGRNSRALVTNTTPCEKPGQVARRGSPDGSYGYSPGSREGSQCPGLLRALPAPNTDSSIMTNAVVNFRELSQGEVLRIILLRSWLDSMPPRRSPQLAAPPPARPPRQGVSSQRRSRGRSSGRTGSDRGGVSPT